MRSVLIAAAGVALLAAPAAGQSQEPQFKNFDQLTICQVIADVSNNSIPVAALNLIRGGLDPDVTIEGVDPFFQDSPAPITLCETLAEQEIAKFCQKNNRKGRKVEATQFCSASRADRGPQSPAATMQRPGRCALS
jgi:hypothetical protein